jgi:heptosyltransferase-3
MKTLVIQLARLGDIFQTRPTLRALKRTNPDGEVHVLVRSKFMAAIEGEKSVDKVHQLNVQEILSSLFMEESDGDESLGKINELLESLEAESYDQVINLTFSPFSSFLVDYIATGSSTVKGYSRFADGTLMIPDDVSAYFFAQVGIGRSNRFHVTDLFAGVSGVDLEDEDFSYPTKFEKEKKIVIHVGASQQAKSLAPEKWASVISRLLKTWSGEVVLVGAANETELSEKILLGLDKTKIRDLVGKTSIRELIQQVGEAELLIGCDSAPVHIASLVKTKVLNLSFAAVNYWETGPRSAGSRVLYADSPEELPSDKVTREAMSMLSGAESEEASVQVTGENAPYQILNTIDESFEWAITKALYLNEDFPSLPDENTEQAFLRLDEVNELALMNLQNLRQDPKNDTAMSVLNRCDEMVIAISQLVPRMRPLISWFNTQKVRIGPGPYSEVLAQTTECHNNLDHLLKVYIKDDKDVVIEGADNGSQQVVSG